MNSIRCKPNLSLICLILNFKFYFLYILCYSFLVIYPRINKPYIHTKIIFILVTKMDIATLLAQPISILRASAFSSVFAVDFY